MTTTVIDDRTPVLNLPLPNAENQFRDDIVRLRSALTSIDTASTLKADLVAGKVPAIQLPSFVDDVVEVADYASLPTTGEAGKIYVLITPYTGGGSSVSQFRWSGSSYHEIVSSPGSTDAVPEGTTNLYFTAGRALAAVPVASASVAGKVKVGSGLTVGGDGTLAVLSGGGSGLPVFTEEFIVPGGSVTTLTPAASYTPGQIELFFNGSLVYGNGDDYTASNGATIALNFTATAADTFLLRRWTYLPESRALNKAGDTMTGSLGLAGNATAALEAVPKQQLDAAVAGKVATGLMSASGLTAPADTIICRQGGSGAGQVEAVPMTANVRAIGGVIAANCDTTVLVAPVDAAGSVALNFSEIPAGVNEVKLHLNGVSTTGNSIPRLQIGAAAVATSGYKGSVGVTTAGAASSVFSTAFDICPASQWNAGNVVHGTITLSLTDATNNVWSVAGMIGMSNTVGLFYLGGVIELGAGNALQKLKLFTTNGSDQFDAGKVNISYKGLIL